MSAVLITVRAAMQLAISSPAVAITIASTHHAYPRKDGQAELVNG